MTQEVQWLAEIRSLQQKLLEVQQEREQAYASAANWRNLYEIEAKQRRQDALAAKATIESLKAAATPHQSAEVDIAEYADLVRHQVDQWESVEQLKQQLRQVLVERDQLIQTLQTEQQAHAQTRQDLTTALGDTMDLLARVRSASRQPQSHESASEAPALATVIPFRSSPPEAN
jgi:hypothetical protein